MLGTRCLILVCLFDSELRKIRLHPWEKNAEKNKGLCVHWDRYRGRVRSLQGKPHFEPDSLPESSIISTNMSLTGLSTMFLEFAENRASGKYSLLQDQLGISSTPCHALTRFNFPSALHWHWSFFVWLLYTIRHFVYDILLQPILENTVLQFIAFLEWSWMQWDWLYLLNCPIYSSWSTSYYFIEWRNFIGLSKSKIFQYIIYLLIFVNLQQKYIFQYSY